VISRLPTEGSSILQQGGAGKFIAVLLIGLGIIVAVVFMDQGQRRIPVQFAKRVVGRRMMGGTSTYLPLKVNQAGVIPIIFATSVLSFPALIASVYSAGWFQNFVNNYVNDHTSPVYMAILTLLVIFFAYFYTAIQFDPYKQADNLRKQGGFIPGIRPGPPTASYLNDILVRITLPGSIFLASVALIPTVVLAVWKFQQFPFGGTSILIAVGVALETMKQIESQLLMRHYEGFLK
jgi:preprotein translocase subunit SecY